MKKILYICPHLSTGGLPAYLLKKIELLKNTYDIYLIEWQNIAPIYNVQRKQLEDILKDKLYSLSPNSREFIHTLIEDIEPDYIHFEEMPEFFMDNTIAGRIYNDPDRQYVIIETTHDSSFDPEKKIFFPDKFAFVSDWSFDQFKSLEIPMSLVEFPIDLNIRPNRESALKNLGLDPNCYHVLNVGLFTSRKNQAEIFEYAKQLTDKKIQFHFVGNQADNFKSYWAPLMANVPKNCKVWKERSDVDLFYGAMDLFLFTSLGREGDKETNPLVIKEALSWQMDCLLYPLDVYLGKYDNEKNVEYLLFDELGANLQKITDRCDKFLGEVINEVQEEPTEEYKIKYPTQYKEKVVSTDPNDHPTFFASKEKILMRFEPRTLGDSIAWIPYINYYREKNNLDVYFKTPYSDLFKDSYPEVKYIEQDSEVNFDKVIDLGLPDDFENWRARSVEELCFTFLNHDPHVRIKCELKLPDSEPFILDKKYVVLNTSCIHNIKKWHYYGGWQQVIDYIRKEYDYEVVLLQKEDDTLNLKNVTKVHSASILEAAQIVKYSEFVVTLASGMSWLGWALGKEVVVISGFSEPQTEFENKHRIYTGSKCRGCWNKRIYAEGQQIYDKCPFGNNYICSREIEPSTVIHHIRQIVSENCSKIDGLRFEQVYINTKDKFNIFVKHNDVIKQDETYYLSINDYDSGLTILGKQFRLNNSYDFGISLFYTNDDVIDTFIRDNNGYTLKIYDSNKNLLTIREFPKIEHVNKRRRIKSLPLDRSVSYPYIEFNYLDIYGDFIKGCKNTIDLGCNVGAYVDYFANVNKDYEQIVAVDIQENLVQLVKETFSDENRIRVLKYAMSDTDDGFIEIQNDRWLEEGTGHFSIFLQNLKEEQKVLDRVEKITLKKLMEDNKIEKLDLLKIDIEGSEYKVFETIEDETLAKINKIILEYHYNGDNVNGNFFSIEPVINKLRKNGFDLYKDCNLNETERIIDGNGLPRYSVMYCINSKNYKEEK